MRRIPGFVLILLSASTLSLGACLYKFSGGGLPKNIRTVAVLPFPVGATYVFRILEAVRTSKVDDAKFGPAQVCQIESPSGEVRVLIVTKVLATALAREYPDDSYVGGWFEVTKLPPRSDKRYADYSITEIDPPVLTEAAA